MTNEKFYLAGGLIAGSILLLKAYADGNGLTMTQAAYNLTSSALWRVDPRGNQYDAAFAQAENANNLPSGILRRMAYQESRFNKDAVSPVGAIGLLQFMPATAADFNIDPHDPFQSIVAAGRYMASLYSQTGSWTAALAAYNWGVGNVLRKGLASAPPETIAYMKMAADVGVA